MGRATDNDALTQSGRPCDRPGGELIGTRPQRNQGADTCDGADDEPDDMPHIDPTAQRLLNLLFVLNASPHPLTTDQIVGDSDLGYGSDNRASDLRKFRRDREKLAQRGVFVTEVRAPGVSETEESSWALDRAQTFAAGGIVHADDARLLIDAIDTYLSAPGTPFGPPLRAIRGKAAEALAAIEGELPEEAGPDTESGDAQRSPKLEAITDALWTAFSLRRAIPIHYVDARGTASKRTVAIYGIFSRGGADYLAAHDSISDAVRTFRIDRIQQVGALRGAYEVPADFDVHDYLFLPFDLTDEEPEEDEPVDAALEAEFSFPAARTRTELKAITYGRGTLTAPEGAASHWMWHIRVRNVEAAASFALSHARDGMRPTAPAELVDAWRGQIEQVVSAHVR